jgi:hypothetical protein
MHRRWFGIATAAGLATAAGHWGWQKWFAKSPVQRDPDALAQQMAKRPLTPPTQPTKRLLGWNVNWVEQSRQGRDFGKLMERLKQLGSNVTRDSHEWAWVQRGKDSPFTKDRHVKAAEDVIRSQYGAASLETLRLLCYGNDSYWTGEKYPSPEQFARFANGFAAYATHIMNDQPATRWLEVWNEWNLSNRFNGDESIRRGPLYAQLLVHAADAIHRKRPDAIVITQGLAISKEANGLPDNAFLMRTLNHPGVLQSADGIGLHPYFFKLQGSPERLMNYLAFTRQQLMREVKGYEERPLPFYITETGFPTAEKSSLAIGSRWGYGIDETLQAAFLARLAILCMSQPHVHGLVFHNLVDSGKDKGNIEHNFGLLQPDLKPKIAWHRMTALVPALLKATDFEWLVGQTSAAGSVKEALDADVAPVFAIRFQIDPGRWCTAIWATSGKPQTVRIKAAPDTGDLQVCDKQYGLSPRIIKPAAGGMLELGLDAEPVYVLQVASGKPAALQIIA